MLDTDDSELIRVDFTWGCKMVGQGQTICNGLASFISRLVQLIVILCCDSIDSITITTRRSLRLINENFVIEFFLTLRDLSRVFKRRIRNWNSVRQIGSKFLHCCFYRIYNNNCMHTIVWRVLRLSHISRFLMKRKSKRIIATSFFKLESI